MPAATLNKIRNADFRLGADEPRHWSWLRSGRGTAWRRDRAGGAIRLVSGSPQGVARMSQAVRVKGDAHYRIEVTLTCQVEAAETSAGFVLSVGPDMSGTGDDRVSTLPIRHADEPVTLHTFYHADEEVTRLNVDLGIHRGQGWAEVTRVTVMEIIEPEQISHMVAAPPPPWRQPPPMRAERVTVCTDVADRPLVDLLRRALGAENVDVERTAGDGGKRPPTGALILPDGSVPKSIRSVRGLIKQAAGRVVIVSTPAFARLADISPALRKVTQEDDPIHAMVAWAGWPTNGFALNDAFPYAWCGKEPGSFVQRQFKRSGSVKRICQRHGLVTLLRALCNRNATSERPIAFYRPTEAGALFVLDLEPVEQPISTCGEPTLAMYLLLNLLGHRQCHLGQYTVPHNTAADFRTSIRDMAERFRAFVVHDEDVPSDELTHQLVTAGTEDASFGLPLAPKPLILVRSGLYAGDVESVYTACLWFKQLVRMMPHACPYGAALGSRFRLAWVPLSAAWERGNGWGRSGRADARAMQVESDGAPVAAVIDLVSKPRNRIHVVVPQADGRYARYREYIPALAGAFGPPAPFSFDVEGAADHADRRLFDWRRSRPPVEVSAQSNLMEAAPLDGPATGSTEYVRIELPARPFDFPSHSIGVTDAGAAALEWVVGLQYGVIAVNRTAAPLTWRNRVVGPGEVLLQFDPNKTAVAEATAVSVTV